MKGLLAGIACWLRTVLRTRQTWTLELFLAIQAFIWGAWLLGPWQSFDVLPGAYTILGLVPEPVWGALFVGHSIAHLIVLHRRDPEQCRSAVLALGGLWSTVLVSLLATIPLSTATPVYGASVLGCAWVYLRLDHVTRRRI